MALIIICILDSMQSYRKDIIWDREDIIYDREDMIWDREDIIPSLVISKQVTEYFSTRC